MSERKTKRAYFAVPPRSTVVGGDGAAMGFDKLLCDAAKFECIVYASPFSPHSANDN